MKLLLRFGRFPSILPSNLISVLQKAASQRADLVSSSATLASPSDTRRRFQTTHPQQSTLHPGLRPQSEEHSESPFRGSTPYAGFSGRERGALDEHSFIQNADNRLDEFLAQGREVLDNLVDQRNMLKGTQKRLLDAAHTMGLSRDVIGWIERRRSVMCVFLSLSDLTTLIAHRICTYSVAVQLSRFSAFI
jgi:Golgi SNAP receptor complex protein 2